MLELAPELLDAENDKTPVPDTLDDFPFRVCAEPPDNSGSMNRFRVCGYTVSSGTMPDALVYAGLSDPFRFREHTFSTASSCFVYLRVEMLEPGSENVTGTLSATLEINTSLPLQQNWIYIVPIARIVIQSGKPRIHQMQFGSIFLAGRII